MQQITVVLFASLQAFGVTVGWPNSVQSSPEVTVGSETFRLLSKELLVGMWMGCFALIALIPCFGDLYFCCWFDILSLFLNSILTCRYWKVLKSWTTASCLGFIT